LTGRLLTVGRITDIREDKKVEKRREEPNPRCQTEALETNFHWRHQKKKRGGEVKGYGQKYLTKKLPRVEINEVDYVRQN